MAEMQRKLVWVERQNFYGWACSECVWVFNTARSARHGAEIRETR